MRSLLIALTLFASTALAQTAGTVSLTVPDGTSSIRVKRDSCDLNRTVNWSFTPGTVELCSSLFIWISSGTGSCADEPDANAYELDEITKSQLATQTSGQVTFKVGDLPNFKGTNAETCPADDREDAYTMCATIKLGGSVISGSGCGSGSYQKANLDVVYDAKPPSAPSIDKVSSLDQALSVHVTVPTDANRLKITIVRSDGTGSKTIEQSSDQPTFHVDSLENNVTYRVTATALDEADNESAASDPVEGTPVHTLGFFDRYVEEGGQETGGCSTASGGGFAGGGVLAVLAFWLSSRRKRS